MTPIWIMVIAGFEVALALFWFRDNIKRVLCELGNTCLSRSLTLFLIILNIIAWPLQVIRFVRIFTKGVRSMLQSNTC